MATPSGAGGRSVVSGPALGVSAEAAPVPAGEPGSAEDEGPDPKVAEFMK